MAPNALNTGETPSFRKLAALLFTDLVGYTALMQADEKKAADTRKKFQSSVKEKVDATDEAGIQRRVLL